MADINWLRVERLVEYAEKHGMDVRVYPGYCEPGYDDGPVVLSNWNDHSRWDPEQQRYVVVDTRPSRLAKAFDRLGLQVDWFDEYTDCDGCGKLFRIEPDSYCWVRYGYIGDGWCMCGDCLHANPYELFEELCGDPRKALTIDSIDPADFSYLCLNWSEDGSIDSCQHGFHTGMDDNPPTIAECLRQKGIDRFIFRLDQASQFYLEFSTWVHKDQVGLAGIENPTWEQQYAAIQSILPIDQEGPNLSDGLRRSLQSASEQIDRLPDGQGIKYARCDASTGEAKVRLVTPQEFVEGGIRDEQD